MTKKTYNPIEDEKKELRTLTDSGVFFHVPRKYTTIFSKTRKFTIKSPFLGTLDFIAAEQIQLRYDKEELEKDWFEEGKRMVNEDAKRCARIVAISVLRDKWKINLFLSFLADYLFWRLEASTLFALVKVIIGESEIANFIGSIRYLHIQKRMTTPILIEIPEEETEEEEQDEEEENLEDELTD